eukprot:1153194-Pelagomonas_calceolata.AAC.7
MRWWHKVFEQLYEYFSKDALDALMCVSARAEVVRHPEPKPSSDDSGYMAVQRMAPGQNSFPNRRQLFFPLMELGVVFACTQKLQAARLQAQKAQQQLTEEERTIEGLESWVAGSKLRVSTVGQQCVRALGPSLASGQLLEECKGLLQGLIAPVKYLGCTGMNTEEGMALRQEPLNHYSLQLNCKHPSAANQARRSMQAQDLAIARAPLFHSLLRNLSSMHAAGSGVAPHSQMTTATLAAVQVQLCYALDNDYAGGSSFTDGQGQAGSSSVAAQAQATPNLLVAPWSCTTEATLAAVQMQLCYAFNLNCAGGSSLMDDHGQAGSSSAAAQAQATPNLLGQVAPIYIVNDVNLLTLMDTVKLLMDSSG